MIDTMKLKRAKELAITFLHLPMTETVFSPAVVMHPFFENGFLYDGQGIFNALEDTDRYCDYLKTFASRAIEPCEDIEGILGYVRKSYRLTFLSFMQKEKIITKKECGNLLAGQWTLIEVMNHDTNVTKNQILSWIKEADKDLLMDSEELALYNAFPEVATIYRGCGKPTGKKGLSWTTNKQKAEWFADRFKEKKSGFVYRANIRREDIVFYTDSRSEQEVVVDFNKLYNIEQV